MECPGFGWDSGDLSGESVAPAFAPLRRGRQRRCSRRGGRPWNRVGAAMRKAIWAAAACLRRGGSKREAESSGMAQASPDQSIERRRTCRKRVARNRRSRLRIIARGLRGFVGRQRLPDHVGNRCGCPTIAGASGIDVIVTITAAAIQPAILAAASKGSLAPAAVP